MKLLYEMHFSINKTLAVSLYMEISLPISGEFLETATLNLLRMWKH